MLKYVKENRYGIRSLLVIRNGYLVTEVYFGPYDTRQGVYSCTKSVISALYGVAIKEGFIKGLDDQILDYFKSDPIQVGDHRKELITLEHLLTMSSGLEPVFSGPMLESNKLVNFVLEKPVVDEPGKFLNITVAQSICYRSFSAVGLVQLL